MDKKILKKKGFKYDINYGVWYYEREDIEGSNQFGEGIVNPSTPKEVIMKFKPNDAYRCEFLKDGKRIGKIHYNAIRLLYDNNRKPYLILYIQGGLYMEIGNNYISIHEFEPVSDSNYLFSIPAFDTISFYIELTMDIKITELNKINF